MQETLVRFLNYSRGGTPIVDAAALLRGIAMNLVRDHFRTAKRRPVAVLEEDIVSDEQAPDEAVMYNDRLRATAQALAVMPRLRREAFIRCRLDGESRSDVARALNISEAAVSKHVARAVLSIHEAFSRQERRGGRS